MIEQAVEIRGYPAGRQVDVLCGLPIRARSLSLFVPGGQRYMWGMPCPETNELATGILDFAMMQGVELPEAPLSEDFAREVLESLPPDRQFTMRLEEVAAWVWSKKGAPPDPN